MHSSRVVKRCTLFGRRFASWICIYLLRMIFSHYVLTNCSIYILYVIRSCCECYSAVFYMSHFLPLFVKLLTFLVGFELTTVGWFAAYWLQHFTTVPRKTTDMYCYLYIYISICLDFLNSEHNCMQFSTWVQTSYIF